MLELIYNVAWSRKRNILVSQYTVFTFNDYYNPQPKESIRNSMLLLAVLVKN